MRSIVEEALSRKRFEDVVRDNSAISAIYDAEAEMELGLDKKETAPAYVPEEKPTPRPWPEVQVKRPAAEQKPLFSIPEEKPEVDLSSQYKYAAPQSVTPTDDDDEFDEILNALKTKITVIGCGGGGSNTVARIYQEGIEGADIYAL
ncbi:MAG: hypothetical protein IJB12_04855, partial [Methanocorpusculum sp.]|nr:hypothetical protein [Methanocorpusculum sp.]